MGGDNAGFTCLAISVAAFSGIMWMKSFLPDTGKSASKAGAFYRIPWPESDHHS